MKRICIFIFALFFSVSFIHAQFVQNVVNAIKQDSLERKVSELSGETSSSINGTMSTITTRVQSNNDLAAEYIKDHFEALNNITINDQSFNEGSGIGRNIIGTQVGTVNPNAIYLICAHYDSVAAFCADDNATGTSAVLEIARILSQYETKNTIVYALWDQEEIGLRGANFYAEQATANGDNIIGVINMDMMGYDGDAPGTPGDNQFDIDFNFTSASEAIAADLVQLVTDYSLNLTPQLVQPGTPFSDHKPFWDEGYGAVLVGEAWESNDQTPFYHTSSDRLATLDIPYFYEMTKLVAAYTATKADIVRVLSLNEFEEEDSIKIYPNPVVSELQIETKNLENINLEFFNIEGKSIQKNSLDTNTSKINLSNFTSGVYFVKITSTQGEKTFKFVKD